MFLLQCANWVSAGDETGIAWRGLRACQTRLLVLTHSFPVQIETTGLQLRNFFDPLETPARQVSTSPQPCHSEALCAANVLRHEVFESVLSGVASLRFSHNS